MTLTLVTLWQREDTTTITGDAHVHYVNVDVPEPATFTLQEGQG